MKTTCLIFVTCLCFLQLAAQNASFTVPDTVCVNTPVNIINSSTGVSNYYWNFCVASIDAAPTATNIGNPGGLSMPVFIDYALYNGNYYGFLVNYNPGRLIRLDFGNSLLNNPTSVDLGNFSGIIPTGAEAIQIVENEGRWYAIIVGGSPAAGSSPRILKVDFGSNLANTSPVATNWGNLGNMLQPIDLHVFKEGSNWYGFTVNSENNTITRFNFTNSFNNTPTAVNLGNIGNLQYPTGIYAINDNGFWRVFVVNGGDNTRTSNACSLTRLDFGSSLLNTPTGTNLGNPGNMLQHPRDFTIMKLCNQIIGFAVNGNPNYNDLVKINFNNNLSVSPVLSSLGNSGSFNFPHSISKLFRVNNDVYGFITNVANNTISRLKFDGCSSSSLPNSTLQNPPAVIYNAPGVYNINLTVDDGLPTQGTYCKQVVVIAPPAPSLKNYSICSGGSIKIGSGIKQATYQWNTGAVTDSINVNAIGTYWVESSCFGCIVRDSFIVTQGTPPAVQVFNLDTTIYAGDVVQLNSYSSSGTYAWSPATNLNCSDCSHPIASPLSSITYTLNSADACGLGKDSVSINVISKTASQCEGFQKAFGTNAYDRAFDIASSSGNEFFTVGVTRSAGNDDILVSKLNLNGNVIWSKTFGAGGAESVRKASPTSDGGLLIIGQTKSFGNFNGDILAFKINNSGTLVWSKKFGVGSASGDLGMDIVETTDGGCAFSGILNVSGGVADAIVVKLDNAANVVWSKRFDHSDGDDGVGIVQKGDTLVVAVDLQNSLANYSMTVMKLKLNDGSFITAKKLISATRGLFNPYLYKNPAQPGYIISGHTIDGTDYSNMKHTIVTINDNLDIINTKLISVDPVTNDFFTGIVPLSDGSFIGTASPQTNADGYLYKINSDNTVAYSKKFNGAADRRLYRLASMGQNIIAVGGTIVNGQEDFFVTLLNKDGTLGPNCNVEDVSISVQQPAYTSSSFTWPTIKDVSFSNTSVSPNVNTINLQEIDLCPRPTIDFSHQQNPCTPKTVQFISGIPWAQSYQWHFGDGQTNNNSQIPTVTYKDYGVYNVKLIVQYTGGCTDSVTKTISVEEVFDKDLILNSDTTICLGDSILVKTGNAILDYCWEPSTGINPTPLSTYLTPDTTTTYIFRTQVVGNNLITNGDFSNGNAGFTSQYINSNSGLQAGVYAVGSNISTWNPNMTPCKDHTTGNGNMMMINGADQPNVNVWSQTINIQPNTNYVFYTWLQTITTTNPTRLQFLINGNALGYLFNANAQSCLWERFYATWNSGNNTTATLSIMNLSQEFSGNDFALDDIFFGEITAKTDSFTINVTGLCDSIKITGPDKVCSKTETQTYSIYKSANCTQQYSLMVDDAFADIVSQTDTSISLVFKQEGTIPLKVAFSNDCRIVADSIYVTVKFSPVSINLGPDVSICRDTLIDLNAGPGFHSYLWQDGSINSSYLVNTPGNYTVLAQNFCGVQFKDTFNLIRVLPAPFKVSPLNAAVCRGDSIQFRASGGTVYSWQPASEFSNPGIASPKAVVNESQDFAVQISDPVCLRDTTVMIPVIARERAEVTITKKNDVNCQLDSTILIANGGVSYSWTPNVYISRSLGNQITVKPTQTITYYLQGIDAGGCIGQDSVTVYFAKEGEQKLFVPNAFTPNNDGLNDVFKPIFTGPATKFDFKIFNRWGQLVFQTNTVGKGWDGAFKFVTQPKDVYVYYITAEGGCNGIFERKGTFVLIK